MNLTVIKNQIEKIINSEIIYNRQVNVYNTSNPAEDLKKSNVITNTKTKYIRITFEYNKTILATCDYAVFFNENIGTNLRQYMVDQLEPQTNRIYSYPTNKHIKYIAKKQNFKPVQNTSLNGWYFKDTS